MTQPPGPPYGAPHQGQPGWGSWNPQQHSAGRSQPPSGGDKTKWILGGLAVALAIALAVVVTVLVVRPDSESGGNSATPTAGGSGSEFFSANDIGPVNIITEDLTCDAWGGVARAFASAEQSVNWSGRDYSIPATGWAPEQRSMYETVAKAMDGAANSALNLVKQTPHRVMRELYGQFVVYANAFVDRVPSYVAKDDDVAAVVDGMSSALSSICSAVAFHSAATVGPLVQSPQPRSVEPPSAASELSRRFLTDRNPVCVKWEASAKTFGHDVELWRAIDPNIAHSEWTPDEKTVMEAAGPVMSASADELERLGRGSGNAVFEDFATLAAQYRRGYVVALPNYTVADNPLSATSTYLVNSVLWACKAA